MRGRLFGFFMDVFIAGGALGLLDLAVILGAHLSGRTLPYDIVAAAVLFLGIAFVGLIGMMVVAFRSLAYPTWE